MFKAATSQTMTIDDTRIHPTAVIMPGAQVGPRTQVGPYAIIGAEVCLGADNVIGPFVSIEGRTTIGNANHFHAHSVVGIAPQVSAWKGGAQGVKIGDRNKIREYASISGSADPLDACTTIGSDNMLMAYSHIGHDCKLGDHIHIANGGTLAGRVVVESNAWISGLCAIHQFVRIGTFSFAAGGAIVTQDIPPFCLVQGDRARLVSLNDVGLRRGGFTEKEIRTLRRTFRAAFIKGGHMKDKLRDLGSIYAEDLHVTHLLEFLGSSERGCITTTRK